jgi:hypothetical protein
MEKEKRPSTNSLLDSVKLIMNDIIDIYLKDPNEMEECEAFMFLASTPEGTCRSIYGSTLGIIKALAIPMMENKKKGIECSLKQALEIALRTVNDYDINKNYFENGNDSKQPAAEPTL